MALDASQTSQDVVDESNKRNAHRRKRVNKRLDDQPWYHGTLPREEILQNLENNGEFLVRTTTQGDGVLTIVISCMCDKQIKHFPISRDDEGWRLEDESYDTIYDLVKHHVRSKQPLTKKSGAIITTGVQRPTWFMSHEDIRREKKLGEGQFGEVWGGKVKLNGKWMPAAIKKAKRNFVGKEKDELIQEAKIMLEYKHRNVVKIIGLAASRPPIQMAIELCPEGSLEDYVRTRHVSVEYKIRFCIQAARGMKYLSAKGCIHRDLALRNVLIGVDGAAKIADFGMTRRGPYKIVDLLNRKNVRLPVKWTAPEAYTKGYNTKTDVFSFGVLMWELFANAEEPWTNVDNLTVMKSVKEGKRMSIPPGTPVEVGKLMHECWDGDPQKRPSFSTLSRKLEAIALKYPISRSSSHTSSDPRATH